MSGSDVAAQSPWADAQLTDLCFLDVNTGWAVGDRGTILHTDDGGAHWHLQTASAQCRLNSVQFIDAHRGWAAGGSTDPYTGTTHGVLLRTRDGGRHWASDAHTLLPTIRQIGFFDLSHGWCIAQPSALFPSGVLTTSDGGRSWSELPGSEGQSWLAADFLDPQTGALVGRATAMASVRRRGIEIIPTAEQGLRAMRTIELGQTVGFAAGDGGSILVTLDRGRTWQTTPGEIPAAARQYIDFRALAMHGTKVWAAGIPGSCVLHSVDAGRSWTLQSTGHTLPLRAIHFIDEQHGWAAGDLGCILSTVDGGRTWRRQHSGGGRAAALGFYADREALPLPLLARLSADEGYLSSLQIVERHDVADARQTELDEAIHEACVSAGASTADLAWQFPAREATLRLPTASKLDTWNRVHDGKALDALERHFVAVIRTWRPDVVLTDIGVDAGDPQKRVISQVLLHSLKLAADPAFKASDMQTLGLAPWHVRKLFGTYSAQDNRVTISPSQLARTTPKTLGELCDPAQAILQLDGQEHCIGLRLLMSDVAQNDGREDVFSGISLSPGGDARRPLRTQVDPDAGSLQTQMRKRRNVAALIARVDNDKELPGMTRTSVVQAAQALDGSAAAELLFQLGGRYETNGQMELAADCFDSLVERFPKHSLAPPALMWLVQFYASGEVRHQLRSRDRLYVGQSKLTAASSTANATRASFQEPATASSPPEPVTSFRAANLSGQKVEVERAAKAAVYAEQLERIAPHVCALPQLRFPLAAANRLQGYPGQAQRFYMSTRLTRPHDAWWTCAQGEHWLTNPGSQPPKPVWRCETVHQRPHLDGQLDESTWQGVKPIELKSALAEDGSWPAALLLARDDEFLYAAISCRKPPGVAYEAAPQRRSRDNDISAHDRIQILIDVDRDWTTFYELALDHRGCTRDMCWRDRAWNPKWFVATKETADSWSAEAAIPMAELTDRLASGQTWAVGIQRVVPGVGFQSASNPASPSVTPEGFAFLRF